MAIFKSLAGPGYVVLNVVRAMNIVALLAVAAACAVMVVKTSLATNFFIFDAATHILLTTLSIFLIVTELNVFRDFFTRYWPLLAQDSGLETLGGVMVILGIFVLGDLNNEAMSQDTAGLPFWRIVLGAGIVAIIFGAINIALSFVFRQSEIGVTARHVRAHGAVAENKAITRQSSQNSFQPSSKESPPTLRSSASTASPRSGLGSRTGSGSMRTGPRFPIKISSPVHEHEERFSKPPSTPNLAVPNLAHHPAMYSNRV